MSTLNIGLALSKINNLEFILIKVYKEFDNNAVNYLEELEQAINSDLVVAKRLVHSVKGISINLGAEKLYEVSSELEKNITENVKELIKINYPKYVSEYKLVIVEIQNYLKGKA